MSMSDPIADMLTRIRNGQQAEKISVRMPSSKQKIALAQLLQDEGYIEGYAVDQGGSQSTLEVKLKYYDGQPVIDELTRVSKPGRRVYKNKNELPAVRDGLGIAIISTSQGIMTGQTARAKGVGGEVICYVS